MDSVGAAISAAAERIAKLQSAFLELESLRGFSSVEWTDLERDFSEKKADVKRKYEELLAQERRLDSETRQVMDSINQRESALNDREEALNLQQQKEIQPMDTDITDLSPTKQREHSAAAAEAPTTALTTTTLTTTTSRSVEKCQVRVRPYLKSLCESMDGEGLRKYVVDHRKDMGALRLEMPSALRHAADPARLVLDAVEGYHDPLECNKGAANSANRRACVLLLEALSSALGEEPVVAVDIKFMVRKVAEQWKSCLEFDEGGNTDGNSLDAQAFLQLLSSYGLGSDYDEEELCKLVLAVTRRKQTPALCKALKLSHKIPEILEHLVNDGKQIEALAFAHMFDMMGRIEPVSLLKAYLKDARKNMAHKGNGNQAQNDNVTKELAAVRNVIKCIEDYNLESEYPSSPLHKRVAHLERTRSERKRTGGSVKGQAKRARNAGYERSYYRSSDKPQQMFSSVSVSPYSLQAAGYDGRAPAGYTTFAADGRRTPYVYSMEGAIYGSPDLYAPQSASYSSYQIGLPPPAQAYQASFMH